MAIPGFSAVILAGGAGRRLGGVAKPVLPVAGEPMVLRVLAAVVGADHRVVVGPVRLDDTLPAGTHRVREDPPGGGPVAAIAAGLGVLPAGRIVVTLAADLPLLTASAVGLLLTRIDDRDGAVYVDADGRRQWLCAAWRESVLRRRLAECDSLTGRALHRLFGSLDVAEVSAPGAIPPWYDCDTADELAVANRLYSKAAEGNRHDA